MPTIEEIAEELNRRSVDYEIGKLQEIRKKRRGLSRRPAGPIFSAKSIHREYAFHWGGRTELQFNIGWDGVDGEKRLRYGAAFSLEPSQSLPESDLLRVFRPKIDRFDEYVRRFPSELDDLRIWAYAKRHSPPHRGSFPVREIPREWVQTRTFIFVGKTGSADSPDYEEILRDFDRLLSVYRYAESIDASPVPSSVSREPKFVPGHNRGMSHTVTDRAGGESEVELRHNDIQDELFKYLVNKVGAVSVGTENVNGARGRIDVTVKSSDQYLHYEIKTDDSARMCIRQALGQLLEYSYWPGALEAERLIVVGEPPLDPEAREYLHNLRERFSIPIHYQQFDLENKRLVE